MVGPTVDAFDLLTARLTKAYKTQLAQIDLSRRPIARLIGGSDGRVENRAVGELASGDNDNRR